jgi:hypothetical protein
MKSELSIPIEQVIEARDSIRTYSLPGQVEISKFTFRYDTFAALRIPTNPPNFQRMISIRRVKIYLVNPDDANDIRELDRVVFLHASFANNTRYNFVTRVPNNAELLKKRYVVDSSHEFDIWFSGDGMNDNLTFNPPDPDDDSFGKYQANFIIEMCYY